jgi:hypothetical protein
VEVVSFVDVKVKNLDLYGAGGEGMLTAEQVGLQLIHPSRKMPNFPPG